MMKQSKTLTAVLESMRDLPAFVGINMDGPNVRGNYGESPLHIAAVQNDLEAIQTLIDSGADIDCVGEHGLHHCIKPLNKVT